MDTKCTAHGLAMMSFVFRPCCGAAKSVSQDRTKVNRPMKLDSNSALGLRSTNAITVFKLTIP